MNTTEAHPQEWTPEAIELIYEEHADWSIKLSHAISAALADEREKVNIIRDALVKLSDECTPPTDKYLLAGWTGKIFSAAVKDICDDALAKVKDENTRET